MTGIQSLDYDIQRMTKHCCNVSHQFNLTIMTYTFIAILYDFGQKKMPQRYMLLRLASI